MEQLSPDKTSTKELLVSEPDPLQGSEGGYGHWPRTYIRVVSRFDCRPDESESLIANCDMVFLQATRYSYTANHCAMLCSLCVNQS